MFKPMDIYLQFKLKNVFILTFFCPFSGPPKPPQNIAVIVLSLTSVQVEWDSGFTGLLQCTLHLQYRAVGDTEWYRLWVLKGTFFLSQEDGSFEYP